MVVLIFFLYLSRSKSSIMCMCLIFLNWKNKVWNHTSGLLLWTLLHKSVLSLVHVEIIQTWEQRGKSPSSSISGRIRRQIANFKNFICVYAHAWVSAWICVCVCVHICVYMKARREHWIYRSWSYGCELPNMDVKNTTGFLWKSSICSQPLNHLSSPNKHQDIFLKDTYRGKERDV